jgi:hypothetical protein
MERRFVWRKWRFLGSDFETGEVMVENSFGYAFDAVFDCTH